jgi:outer membrane protein, heavy metal efflux system
MSRIPALLAIAVGVPCFAAAGETVRMDLDRALAAAREKSPRIRAAHLRIEEARGNLTSAGVLLKNNPSVSAAYGRRSGDDEARDRTDSEVALSQEIEMGGQRRHRIAAATAAIDAARAGAEDAERTVLAAVAAAWFDAVVAAGRLRLAEENTALAQEILVLSTARVEQGAGPPIELNAGRIRVALARSEEAEARSAKARAGLALLTLIGMDPDASVELPEAVPAPADVPALEVLIDHAGRRPDVLAAQAEVRVAEGALRLADAERVPSPVLGGAVEHDEGDTIVSGTLAIGLPVFQRNQGERRRARAALDRAGQELTAVQLEAQREVRELFAAYVEARDTLGHYDGDVVRAVEENLALLRLMFEAGKIGYAEVALLQRERLDTSLALLRARAEVARTALRLRAAAGLPPLTEAPQAGR